MTYAPPPGMAQPKKGTNPLVWIFVALGAFCCIAIIAFGAMTAAVFNQTQDMFPCLFSMSTLQDSMDEYVKDKGVFPPADRWQDELAPIYDKKAEEFKADFKDAPGPLQNWGKIADINGELGCNTTTPKTFIAYNPEIAGKKFTDIKDPAATPMFYETTTTGRNIAAPYVAQPFKTSPKLMGSPRGWYEMNVEGQMVVVDEKGKRTEVDISTGR